jgi:molybdate transport system permease protein
MRMRTSSAAVRFPKAIVALAAVGAAFLLLPLVALLLRAPWAELIESLRGAGAGTALRLSIVVSVMSTVLSVLLGVPLAWLLARVRFPGRSLVRTVAVLPIVLPPVVGGIGLLEALGRRGVVGRFLYDALGVQLTFTTWGAVIAAAFVSMPLVVLAGEAGFRSLDLRLELAASTLGAAPGYVLRHVTLPLVAPHLAAGAVLAWARALGEFGATITFAGNLPGRTQTLPLAVYEASQVDPGGAVLLSLMLVSLSIVVLFVLRDRLTQGR